MGEEANKDVLKEFAHKAPRKIESFDGNEKSWGNFYLCILYAIALPYFF